MWSREPPRVMATTLRRPKAKWFSCAVPTRY